MIGNHMIIFGGIDDFQSVLNDVVSFDLINNKWSTIYENDKLGEPS